MNVRVFVLVVCLALGVVAAYPADRAFAVKNDLISDAETVSRFMAAVAAYKAEDYDKAIAAYEEILRAGKESGALYYNLGNSYFKKGSLGKAILNYERARRLIPRDGDLNFNLEYARAKANLPAVVGISWPRLVEQRICNWTEREIGWGLVVIAFGGAALHLASLFGCWPVRARRHVIGLVCLLWLIFVGGLAAKFSAEKDLAVAVAESEAKFEPREDAVTYFPLTEGAMVKILAAQGVWAKVKRADGKVGWVPEKAFERF